MKLRRPIIEFGPAPRFIDQPDLFGRRINLPGITICLAPVRSRDAARAAVAETVEALRADNIRLREDISAARDAVDAAQRTIEDILGGGK